MARSSRKFRLSRREGEYCTSQTQRCYHEWRHWEGARSQCACRDTLRAHEPVGRDQLPYRQSLQPILPIDALSGRSRKRALVSDGPRGLAGSKLIADFEGWLKIAGSVADDFELRGIHDRTDAIKKRISKQKLTNFDISTEARVLLETLQAGLKGQLVYRYPDEKSRVFYKWTEDWSAALKSFQSARRISRPQLIFGRLAIQPRAFFSSCEF